MISRFKNEVLSKGPGSTLPKNLSDEWLDILSEQADPENGYEQITELLAAVIHILAEKNGGKEIQFEEKELFDYFESYRLELAMEEVNRRTEVNASRPTIETIFTNRNVEF